jgi:hypothetical protein
MSKTKVSASAIGLPSRRLFLAAGPAAAVLTSLRKAAAEDSPIVNLIALHRQAVGAFYENAAREEDILCSVDSREAPEMWAWEEENTATFWAMENSFRALCAEPARSLAEAAIKAASLLEYEGGEYGQDDIVALLNSFLKAEV